MTVDTKNNIFKRYQGEYWKATKERKGEILTHIADVVGMHKKSIIRKFRTLQLRDPAKQEGRGRRVYYDNAVTAALRNVW